MASLTARKPVARYSIRLVNDQTVKGVPKLLAQGPVLYNPTSFLGNATVGVHRTGVSRTEPNSDHQTDHSLGD